MTYNHYEEALPQWLDDGDSISFISSESIHQITTNGHEISRFDNPHIAFRYRSDPFEWSSDKQNYAFSSYDSLFYGTNPDGSDLQRLKRMEHNVAGLEWAPNSEQILYYDRIDKLFVFNVKTKVEDFSLNMDVTHDARWSPDGSWIAMLGRIQNESSGIYLYLLDIHTGDIQTVAKISVTSTLSISWSPDSEWIAFPKNPFDDEEGRIFKIKRDGTGLQQLLKLDCQITEISWSPN